MPRWMIYLGLSRKNGSTEGDKTADRIWTLIILVVLSALAGGLVVPRAVQFLHTITSTTDYMEEGNK